MQRAAIKKEDILSQTTDFRNGNEAVALAAKQINYHLMGYYPITPSTQIAEELDAMKAEGLHNIVMVPGDGEHGAAGICYGASTAGGRVLNATSANGLMYAFEQLPVQSGTRYPMVLNVVCRSISGPLDIRCDHSDIMMALSIGWIILFATNPQEVYDLNIMAPKIGEDKEVMLPVIVGQDGFFTSHQKRPIRVFSNDKDVQNFLGEYLTEYTSIDPERPITIGPYMNDPDLINNKKQLSMAMDAADSVIDRVFGEFYKISGRKYEKLRSYKVEDAEVVLLLLGSSYNTARIAVDNLRKKGLKVGVMTFHVLRPFPAKELVDRLSNARVVVVGERQESFGARSGSIALEVKAALFDAKKDIRVINRVYGIGGKDFYISDGEELLELGLKTLQGEKVDPFEYHGAYPGGNNRPHKRYFKPITGELADNELVVTRTEDGDFKIKGVSARSLAGVEKRIAPGHGACPGCGIFPSLNQFFKGIKGDIVVLFQTGCGMVVTTGYPYTSHRVTYIHNLFQNGAATLSGVVEMFKELKRRGQIPEDRQITFIMVSGDGGMDIGMGPAIGAALRNHGMILLEYDNEGYMNTGNQLSFTTPKGHATSTSHVGSHQKGKTTHHKDTPQIMAGTHIPYIFTGAESFYRDLIKKAAKAQWYANNEGFVYGKVLSCCPLSWRSDERYGAEIIKAAVDSCFFPLYEIEHGITKITYDPEEKGCRVPISEWFKRMGKTKHLVRPEYKDLLKEIEQEVERRWRRLKAMHENPIL